jgi:hypothetical protein
LTTALAASPDSAAPIDAVAAAVEAAAGTLQDRRDYTLKRQAVIAANTDLQQRELIKLASLAAALGDTLRRRGVPEPDASLSAQAGIAVFEVGFERWITDTSLGDFATYLRESLHERP